jgi:flagellar hook-associated protein 2
MGSETGASSVFSRLPDIGLDIGKDGTLSTKSSKLNAALDNLPEMKKFFSNVNEADTTKNGIGQRVAELTKKLLQDDGAIDSKTDGLNSTIKRNKDKIERIEDRVTLMEARLRAQYSALDTNVSKLSGLQSYVSAQLAALNKN